MNCICYANIAKQLNKLDVHTSPSQEGANSDALFFLGDRGLGFYYQETNQIYSYLILFSLHILSTYTQKNKSYLEAFPFFFC